MSDSTDREKELFIDALGIDSKEDRDAFLRAGCGGDEDLLNRVQKLLSAHDAAGAFLKGERTSNRAPTSSAATGPRTQYLQRVSEGPGTVIGRYKLLQKIGEGGFGIVYMAEQREPVKRRVALKIIKLGMDTKQVVARFEAERQALAMMDHPNIAKVLDGGETETGRPYFVMELVRGIPVLQFCDEKKFTTEERLQLFIKICEAIHHAHQKGVIHRDIKPSNILVTLHDDRSVPKVIDFGIAKATQQELTEKTVFTRYQEFVGTPAYMSPEQAQFSGLDIDTRTDIYSLGVLLYELLTGRTPFDTDELLSGGYDAMRQIIREKDPLKPSTQLDTLSQEDLTSAAVNRGSDPVRLRQRMRGDLDWIVLKAIEKDRTRRYESALALAHDIRNHLADEPVTAVAPSLGYRFSKFARRNRLALAASVAIALTLIIGTVVSTTMAYRAVHAEKRVRELLDQELEARRQAQESEKLAKAAEQRAANEAAIAAAVNEFLNEDLLGHANPINEPDRDLRLRTLLDRASGSIDKRFEGSPLAEAAIRFTMGQAYLNLGDHVLAETHAARAIALQEQALEKTDPDLVRSRILLAAARVSQGRYREMERPLERLLSFSEEHFTPSHELSIETAYWLSKAYAQVSRADDGEKLMVRYLPISQETLPNDHWLRPTIVNERGYYHVAYRRMSEAEEFSRLWLTRYRAEFGREHPYSIMLMHNLASALIYQGKYDEAKATYEETLTLKEKVLGREHPSRIKTLAEFAWYYRFMGDPELAEKLLEESFAMARRVLGDAHPDTRKISSWVSGLYLRTGRKELQREFLLGVLKQDPGNQHALEHLAGFLDFETLTPVMPDAEDEATSWKYTMKEPVAGWEAEDFDDASWQTGRAPFGNASPPGFRTRWDGRTIWLRREFELDSVPRGRLVLRLLQDDNSLVFINGVVALERQSWTGRRRMPIYALADGARALKPGRNVVAIRADNIDLEGVIDLGIYLETIPENDDNPVLAIGP